LIEQSFRKVLQNKYEIPSAEIDYISQYLVWRKSTYVKGDDSFGVVFVTSKYCNLACKHCAIDAMFRDISMTDIDYELSTQQIIDMFQKLHIYVKTIHQNIFFMFGGGEPTLREDFPVLLKEAKFIFGETSIGFCTNGTFLSPNEVISLAGHVGLLEVSLDGFEEYHNQWRPPTKGVSNPYLTTLEVIQKAVPFFSDKLEVTSMVTKSNMNSLPMFARYLRDIGVKYYSIHRPVSIGRMFHQRSNIPDVRDYLLFFASMAKVALEDKCFSLHLHHSLESIYSALLIGKDIHLSSTSLGSRRHSIGVDSDGSVHFDPWALLPPLSVLSPGNLCDPGKDIAEMLEDQKSILNLIAESKKANVRCYQCAKLCSGGMRLAGIIESITKRGWPETIMPGSIIAAISSIDPACPLSSEQH